MIAMDGELYTWGSNLHGCLGHAIRDQFVEHTADPGRRLGLGPRWKGWVEVWSATALRAGVHDRRDVYLYEGPTEDVARKLGGGGY